MWTLKISKQAAQFYARLHGKEKERLAVAFDVLREEPRQGKPLKGDLGGYWSYRVGVYRIIYSIVEGEIAVCVLRIHHRKEVYERLRR